MATSSDDMQLDDPVGSRASVAWHSFARADVVWLLFGLALLVAVLWLAVVRG